ncbi:ubiquitin-protein ligase PSH1 [Gigaspora margarita]|uniref:RING-type E3 ubiquitin transferase n=1 Tax=Gigaspora margarita TaxID=4874 RepID=A0A8H3XB85_GIGMA|nr:ubiquitin-protein ligase PSH1 [Gigaspora margarita]
MGIDSPEPADDTSDSEFVVLNSEENRNGNLEMNESVPILYSDITSDENNTELQTETTNSSVDNNIDHNRIELSQDITNLNTPYLNQQTEEDECEQYVTDRLTSTQISKNRSNLRNRGVSIHKSSKQLKQNISTGRSSGISLPSSSAGEGSSRDVKGSPNCKINGSSNINSSSSEYECNICFDTASAPVLTLCGHLFCWPCLHQWLEAQSQNPLCPVCKAGCGQDKVIPIYGRGKEAKDPRKNADIPNRPAGQRPQPQRDLNQPGTQFFPGSSFHSAAFGPHFSISAGTIFPSLFGAQFTFPPPNGPPSPQQAFLSRLLLMFGCLIVIMFLLY